jgi:hypothetical protein
MFTIIGKAAAKVGGVGGDHTYVTSTPAPHSRGHAFLDAWTKKHGEYMSVLSNCIVLNRLQIRILFLVFFLLYCFL